MGLVPVRHGVQRVADGQDLNVGRNRRSQPSVRSVANETSVSKRHYDSTRTYYCYYYYYYSCCYYYDYDYYYQYYYYYYYYYYYDQYCCCCCYY